MAKIALAQFAPGSDFEAALDGGAEMAAAAAAAGARFVGFTELAFRPFFPQHVMDAAFFSWGEPLDGPTSRRFQAVAREHGIDCGINFYENAGGGRFYDTTVVCRPNGEILGPVRMAHVAEEPGYNEKYYYWPGDTPPRVFDLDGLQIGIAICYDRHFPEFTRALVLQGCDLIFSPFAGLESDPMEMYEIEMQGLAFQNQIYIACVNRVGPEGGRSFAGGSFVVGPQGDILQRAPRGADALLLVDIDLAMIEQCRLRRPFLRDRRPRFYAAFPA